MQYAIRMKTVITHLNTKTLPAHGETGSARRRKRPPDINPFFCPAYGSASLGYAKGGQFFFARTLLRDFPRKLCSITFIDVYQRAQTIG